jgi:hypothetical protein
LDGGQTQTPRFYRAATRICRWAKGISPTYEGLKWHEKIPLPSEDLLAFAEIPPNMNDHDGEQTPIAFGYPERERLELSFPRADLERWRRTESDDWLQPRVLVHSGRFHAEVFPYLQASDFKSFSRSCSSYLKIAMGRPSSRRSKSSCVLLSVAMV